MSGPRRHRLHSLGMSTRAVRGGAGEGASRARYRDDGLAVRAMGIQPGPALRRVVPAPVRSFSATPSDWDWPVAEPSALSWPEPEDTAAAFSVSLGAASADIAQPAYSPPFAAQPPLALDDDEAGDDVAAILRENGLVPTPPAPVSAPARSQPPADEAPEPAPPAEDRHAIFGQLGSAMSHANSFQLGRFNFDRHFDMLEEGMSLHPASTPAPRTVAMSNARELHDLDVMSELAAMSEAAGVPLRRDADSDAFMKKVARAQGLSGRDEDDDSTQEEEDATEEEFASLNEAAEEDAHSPWSENQDEEEAEEE